MLNPAYKTDRKRQNIKDFLGVNKALGFKSKKAESELANIFDLAVAGKVQGLSKQPLLSEVMEGNNKNQIDLMKSPGRTVQEISTPLRKDLGRGKGKTERAVNAGEMEAGRHEVQIFSDKPLEKN